MTKQYYVAYAYQDSNGIGYGCDIPFATGPISYQTIVRWREDIQRLKHPEASITILYWQQLAPDA